MNGVATSQCLKIGEVAKQFGLSVKTLRYYDERGLLTPTVQRSPSGYRLFHPTVFGRLGFIKRAQALGLSLEEIQEVLSIHDQGQLPCGMIKQYLLEKLTEIEKQIESLDILKSELTGILSGWQEQPLIEKTEQTICPNIQSP
ncbi:heavy metal-responsive transcriptional regulator [Crocosphaera sp. UHCC 0190]|uniref:heavy metal-responsive transcriptional regulator n=1 Tax=Crocosphaera sp. UHCC 0190 TaxID=3110246 RepID=UPI002B1F4FDF|nr:heavy metal-responsive transcriptional regulator [Crocosphaera sp. UHCC 0190]MEA5512003.1 heavy metal-responsive transcriptional regulator [Crocosphaera sp. UHCC 0190]